MLDDLWEFWDTDTWGDDTWGDITPGTASPSLLTVVGDYVPTLTIIARIET